MDAGNDGPKKLYLKIKIMEKICSQTTIPSVDNTVPLCDDLTLEDCVVANEARIVPIIINPGDTYKTVLNTLLLYIKTLEDRILILETP